MNKEIAKKIINTCAVESQLYDSLSDLQKRKIHTTDTLMNLDLIFHAIQYFKSETAVAKTRNKSKIMQDGRLSSIKFVTNKNGVPTISFVKDKRRIEISDLNFEFPTVGLNERVGNCYSTSIDMALILRNKNIETKICTAKISENMRKLGFLHAFIKCGNKILDPNLRLAIDENFYNELYSVTMYSMVDANKFLEQVAIDRRKNGELFIDEYLLTNKNNEIKDILENKTKEEKNEM